MRQPRTVSACAALLLLGACTEAGTPAADSAAAGDAGGTLVISTPAEPDLLLPPFMQSLMGRQIVDLAFDHLAEPGQDLNSVGDAGFTPRLARAWTWAPIRSPSPSRWTRVRAGTTGGRCAPPT